MEIKVGTHKKFSDAERITLGAVLASYSCSDRCDRNEVLNLREELIKTKMIAINDDNKCIVTRAIKFELEVLKFEIEVLKERQETPKVRRYKEMLTWLIQKTNQ